MMANRLQSTWHSSIECDVNKMLCDPLTAFKTAFHSDRRALGSMPLDGSSLTRFPISHTIRPGQIQSMSHQENDSGISNQRQRSRQFALVASGVGAGAAVLVRNQAQLFQIIVHDLRDHEQEPLRRLPPLREDCVEGHLIHF